MSKSVAGLVCVNPSALANVDQYGVDHIVHKASSGISWNALQPTSTTYNWDVIDDHLNAYPNAFTTLRIQSGGDAPSWLKSMFGTVLMTYPNRQGATVYVPHWWEDDAMLAWDNMIQAVGARYDNDPRVVMVSADAPMGLYSEPFILGSEDATAIRLFNAGLNETTMFEAIRRCVNSTCDAFPNTVVELAIHGDIQIPTAGGMTYSWPKARSLALEFANAHGAHIAFSDYGVGPFDTLAANPQTGTILTETNNYAWMKTRAEGVGQPWGGPVTFQLTLNGNTTAAHYEAAARNCIAFKGQMSETSGWGSLDGALITELDGLLKANEWAWDGPGDPPPATGLEPVGVFTGGNDGGTSNVTTQTLTLPVAAAVGDVAIVMSSAFSTTATATIASGSAQGWTLLSGPDASFTGSNYQEYLWARTLTAGDIGNTVVVTWSAQLAGLAVGVVYPAGCTIGPDAFATVVGGASAITPTGVAATAGDALLLFVTAKANSGATPATATLPGTATSDKVSATASVAGTNFGTVAAHQPVDTTGTVGNTSIPFSVATNGASAYTLVLSPPASSPGLPVWLRSGGAWVPKHLIRVP